MDTKNPLPRVKRRAGEVCCSPSALLEAIVITFFKSNHLGTQTKKPLYGKKGVEELPPPRLCEIYLRDALGFLNPESVHACRQVSTHSYNTIYRVGEDRLSRYQFEVIKIRPATTVRLQSCPLHHTTHDRCVTARCEGSPQA